jgi:hypothetical protein
MVKLIVEMLECWDGELAADTPDAGSLEGFHHRGLRP